MANVKLRGQAMEYVESRVAEWATTLPDVKRVVDVFLLLLQDEPLEISSRVFTREEIDQMRFGVASAAKPSPIGPVASVIAGEVASDLAFAMDHGFEVVMTKQVALLGKRGLFDGLRKRFAESSGLVSHVPPYVRATVLHYEFLDEDSGMIVRMLFAFQVDHVEE